MNYKKILTILCLTLITSSHASIKLNLNSEEDIKNLLGLKKSYSE
eukprot:COSAG01_NODE_51484_length_352_cov_1.141176_1_plen_44_part_10